MPQEQRLLQVETDPTKVWYRGDGGTASALTRPLPGRVVDCPVEELEGDAEILDGVGDEEDRRAT